MRICPRSFAISLASKDFKLATLIAPTTAYRYKDKKTKWHLVNPRGQKGDGLHGIALCGQILWTECESAQIKDLDASCLCQKCLGPLTAQ